MATSVAVFALVLAYLALVGAFCALRTLAKLRRDTHLLSRGTRGPKGQQSLIEVTQQHAETAARVADEIAVLRAHVDSSQEELRSYVMAAQQAMTAQVESGRQEALAAVVDREGSEAGALRHVALVRYDAFNEMSGHMSFSLALLDDGGSGVTISAITGRADTRVYAKSINAGAAEHELSPEESQVVSAALGKQRRFRKAG